MAEEVGVKIYPLNSNSPLRLISHAPLGSSLIEGTVGSTSGVDLTTGVSKDGPSFGVGTSFGNSYSENLRGFRIIDRSNGNAAHVVSRMAGSSASDTWSTTGGGLVKYDRPKDLLRMDAAGQFDGTPLNFVPEKAISV